MKRVLCLLLVLLLTLGLAACGAQPETPPAQTGQVFAQALGARLTGTGKHASSSSQTSAVKVVDVLAGERWSVCLLSDGSARYAGDPGLPAASEIPRWRNVVRIESSEGFLIGYRKDGGVVLACTLSEDDYAMGYRWTSADLASWRGVEKLCLCADLCVGLRGDGTVLAVAGSDEYRAQARAASAWRNICDLATDSYSLIVGLKKDGSVVYTDQAALAGQGGYWGDSWGDPSEWHDIERLIPVWNGIYALRKDGVLLGMDDASWNNVVQICSGTDSIFGLRSDGTVAVERSLAAFSDPRITAVASWKNIRELGFSWYVPVGLRRDGTVCAVTSYEGRSYGGWDFTGWTDVQTLYCSDYFTVGLRSDGSALITGGECGLSDFLDDDEVENWNTIVREVSRWSGIQKVVLWEPYLGSVRDAFVIGLRTDGTLVSAGSNAYGRLDFPPELRSAGAPGATGLRPSEADLQAVGDRIQYPKAGSYLSAYKTMSVNVSSTHIYYNPDGSPSHKRPYYALYGEEVLVLAQEGKLSCVIFTKDGVLHSGWIYTTYLDG